MFGVKQLKRSIKKTETTVECPVKGCSEEVERQREVFKREQRFQCPKHNLYISPSTFEYQRELDNLLWKDKADLDLFEKIKEVKRESRIARDNSEDAVTWNVFRFLEKYNLLSRYLSKLVGNRISNSEIIYWSYSPSQKETWHELQEARKQFETRPQKGSEPDIVVRSNNALFFVEAKLKASNNTVCRSENPEVWKKYETSGYNWFSKIFKSGYKTVAIDEKKYELLRFWLLGTWMAKRQDLNFYLVNLVLSEREKEIEAIFGKHTYQSKSVRFLRITWEDIYYEILNSGLLERDKDKMIGFFRNKTIGYDSNGKLQKAFLIP